MANGRLERRYLTGWREEPTDDPGIIITDDGLVLVRDYQGVSTGLPADSSPPFPDPSHAHMGDVLGLDSNLHPAWITPEWEEAPTNSVAPVIMPVAALGHTLAAGDWLAVGLIGAWTGPRITGFSYHWEKNPGSGWVDVAGDPAFAFVQVASGVSYRCTVTATNATGSTSAVSNVLACP